MKTHLFIILMLCGWCTTVYGQSVVSGRVIDKTSKSPLEYVSIAVVNHAGTFVRGVVTNTHGRFTVNDLKKGSYRFRFSCVGYRTDSLKVNIGEVNHIYDMGTIPVSEEVASIGEVVVEGQANMVSGKLEKKTFNVVDNIAQAGGSVLEVMRNLPGVTVDREGKVFLRGSDKVVVLIDGQQSSLTGFGNQKGLDNISAAHVDRIEVINNPSAKYDAQGMAGIINIIYKEEKKEGLNGEAGFNFGLGELTKRKDNLPDIMDKYSFTPKYSPSVNLNYRTNKINLFLQSDAMFRKKVNSNEFTTRRYTNGSRDLLSQFLENREQQQYTVKLGLDWWMGKNDQLTFFALFEDEYHIDRGHVPYDYLDGGGRKRFWTWAEDERTWAMNYQAAYKHQFAQAGHVLEASFLYTHGVEDEVFPFTDLSEFRNSTDETRLVAKEKIAALKVDYVKPLFNGRLEAGTKMQWRSIPITYNLFPGENSILDPNLGRWSDYQEDIYAWYANYVFESKYVDVEAGVRAEKAVTDYRVDPMNQYYKSERADSRLNLFPNVRISFRLTDAHKISLFYNRRVDRPGEFDLRPFPKYDDPEILKTGNPYLKPQFTEVMEMAYKASWNSGSLFLAGYYKTIRDPFTRVYVRDPYQWDVLNGVTQNLGRGKNYGLEVVLEQQITKKWNVNAGFNWYKNVIGAFDGEILYPTKQSFSFEETKGNTWNVKLNTSLKVTQSLDVQGAYIYYAKDVIPQGVIDGRGSLDIGLRKKALDGRLEFSLSATDLLNTFQMRQTVDGQEFTMHKANYYETQVVTCGLKYRF